MSRFGSQFLLTLLAALLLAVGPAIAQDDDLEYEVDEGVHEEEWYDPSDWGDDWANPGIDYETDAWDYDYYDDYDYDAYDDDYYGDEWYEEDYDDVYGYDDERYEDESYDYDYGYDYDYDYDWGYDYYTEDWYEDEGVFYEWYE
jgi:hypothetical protein